MNLALPLRPVVSRADSALLPTQIVERNDACDDRRRLRSERTYLPGHMASIVSG